MIIDFVAQQIIDEIKKNLIKEDKIATGKLIKSLDYRTLRTVEGWTIQILGEKYLEFVDKGRKPGKQPPIGPILKWIQAKPIKFVGKTDKQMAFIIARSIGKKGIVPTNVINKSIKKVLDNLQEIISIEKLYSI